MMNAIRVVGIALLVFMFFMAVIILNVRKRKDSSVSILARILTNYLQLVSVSLSFELKFPNALFKMLAPISKFGNSNQSFLPFY